MKFALNWIVNRIFSVKSSIFVDVSIIEIKTDLLKNLYKTFLKIHK